MGCFKNIYEFVNLWAPKFSILNKNHLFWCMGKIFCVGFQRFLLKFHTNSCPYNDRCVVYWWVKIYELLDLWAPKCLRNAPQVSHGHWWGTQHNYKIYFCSTWQFCQSKCSFVGLAHRNDKLYLFFGKSLLQRALFYWPVCSPPYYPSHHASNRKLARLFEGPWCDLSAKTYVWIQLGCGIDQNTGLAFLPKQLHTYMM